jgi:hypothetical protein
MNQREKLYAELLREVNECEADFDRLVARAKKELLKDTESLQTEYRPALEIIEENEVEESVDEFDCYPQTEVEYWRWRGMLGVPIEITPNLPLPR